MEISEIFDECHKRFKEMIATKERPLFRGKEIYVPLRWIECKAEIFWHSASIDSKPNLDIKPCTNDLSSAFCPENCISGAESITMSNGDVRVKYWEKVNSKKRNRLYLRYQEEELDYLIVFEDKSEKRVQLITAYPIFFVSAKRDYENDYQNHIKNLTR